MQKKELKALKRINATDKMMKLAANNKLEEPLVYDLGWTEEKKSTRYDMFVRCQTRGAILMVCLFFPEEMQKGRREPLYEIYINAEGNQWINRIQVKGQQEKWSTAKVGNLGKVYTDTNMGSYYGGAYKKRIWQNPEGKKSIQRLLGTKAAGIDAIVEWQDEARIKQVERAEKRQQAPWDADMKLVPPILDGYLQWAVWEKAKEHFIFYDFDKHGAKEGYCSYCKKMVPITTPKHNKKIKCPVHKKQVILKVKSKSRTLIAPISTTQCIQKIKGGIVVREYDTYFSYEYRTVDNPKEYINERRRTLIFDDGSRRKYYWGMYKNKYLRWIPGVDDYWSYYSEEYGDRLYKKNLGNMQSKILKESAMKFWKRLPCDVEDYLYIEQGNPAVEKLAKIGMFELAEDMITKRYNSTLLNQDATELAKMLKIDNARLKRLKDMNGGLAHLRWMQMEKLANTVWPDKMITDFTTFDIEPGEFEFLPPNVKYLSHIQRIWNYVKKQSELSGKKLSDTVDTWRDYENMAEKAKWNVASEQILYPKNLQAAHNEVVMYLKGDDMKKEAQKLEKKWPKVKEVLPAIWKFEYTAGEYTIVAPKEILDIVKEGTALSHCVHTCDYYFDRIQKHESYLFFLRKANTPDKPWYTLEVEPSGNIRQKRTTGDNQNEDFKEAIEFLKKWQQVFKSRLTKEEKELGIIADKKRIEEYKALREKGNKVWHGKLAGQLLADVLEKDFMAAI